MIQLFFCLLKTARAPILLARDLPFLLFFDSALNSLSAVFTVLNSKSGLRF